MFGIEVAIDQVIVHIPTGFFQINRRFATINHDQEDLNNHCEHSQKIRRVDKLECEYYKNMRTTSAMANP